LKRELIARFDWNIQGAFQAVDIYGEDVITTNTLSKFLKVNGFSPTSGELDAIMRRLDTNCDFILSFNEFVEVFIPRRCEAVDERFNESPRSSPLR
jgi:Ca2+-binding EF-hand superfamily protein